MSPNDPSSYGFNPHAVPLFLTTVALLALSVLVLAREGRTQTGRAFALVTVSAALWLFCLSWMYCAAEAAVALWWAKTAYWIAPFIPAAIYQFTLLITSAVERDGLRSSVSWAGALLFAFLMARTDLMFDSVELRFWGFYPRYEWPSVFFVAGFAALSALALFRAFRESREAAPGWHRDRVRAFTAAFGIGCIALADHIPSFGVSLYPFGCFPVLVFVALSTRAVLEYRLSDVTPAHAAAQIVATLPEALIAYDSRNRIRSANQAACSLLELDERALAALPVEALIDGHSESDAALRTALSRGTPLTVQGGLRSRRGERIDVRLLISPLLAPDGSHAGAILLAEDIRHERGAEDAAARSLRQSESRLLAVLGSGSLLSVLLDTEGRVTHASEALHRFLGVAGEEILGRDWFAFVPEDDRESARRAFRAAIHTQDLPLQETSELLAADGDRRHIAWHTSLLRDQSKITGAALIGLEVARMPEGSTAAEASLQDPLTGLTSRAQLLNRLVGCFEAARGRPQYRFALLFGDVDRFKLVNESLGHSAGDKLLIELARRLETCVRQGDVVARVGADEFALLLDDIGDAEVARHTAERIHRALERPFGGADGGELFLTMSVGIARNRSRYRAPEDLLRDAETAMFSGRRVGRSRSREFETGMHSQVLGQLQIESDLRRAIERNELLLMYQPVVSLASGEVSAFEALLRWNREGQGLVPPDRFIGVAEETGLILTIGRWALETACRQLKTWQDSFGLERGLQINVNVSARQFEQDDFGAVVAQALAVSGAAPEGLKLEITESVIMAEPEAASAHLLRLRERGVGVCLDDFGTGYSSLSYLTRIPADVLKIDKSFVSRLAEGAEQEEMVRAIVGLAHGLKMAVIAEGVETRDQLERLRALDCEYVQGFYLARALDVPAAEELLASRRPLAPGLRSITGGRR